MLGAIKAATCSMHTKSKVWNVKRIRFNLFTCPKRIQRNASDNYRKNMSAGVHESWSKGSRCNPQEDRLLMRMRMLKIIKRRRRRRMRMIRRIRVRKMMRMMRRMHDENDEELGRWWEWWGWGWGVRMLRKRMTLKMRMRMTTTDPARIEPLGNLRTPRRIIT